MFAKDTLCGNYDALQGHLQRDLRKNNSPSCTFQMLKKNPWIVVEKSNSGLIYYSTLNLEVAYRYILAILHLILPDRFCFWFSFHHSSFRYMRTIQTMEEWYHLKKLHFCLFVDVIYFTYCYQISWYTEQKAQRQNSNKIILISFVLDTSDISSKIFLNV